MLKLRFAAGGYDRLDALQYGLVKPKGINLEFNEINAPRQIFDGMLGGELFDVSEFSSSEFITRTLRGN
ncbi:MAG: 4,5-dihydroxyphthalate decarboxylase, partial [Rhodospirillaceae bacterium]|nr:4,5-dihydroxyphthalate decarboxylase [Rhodospirillaceae bacterium]